MKPERLWYRRFFPAMIVYVILVIVSVRLVETLEDSALRFGVALLPVIPILFGMAAFLAYLRRLDELQRRIQFEAFGFSLGLTGLVTFTLGLMENAGLPRVSLLWVFPMLVAFWGIGHVIAGRRYQ